MVRDMSYISTFIVKWIRVLLKYLLDFVRENIDLFLILLVCGDFGSFRKVFEENFILSLWDDA